MAEPNIYVIPEQYYGGKAPKDRKEPRAAVKTVSAPATAYLARKKKAGPRKIIFLGAGTIFFVFVVAVAAWYYTRDLRQSTDLAPADDLLAQVPSLPEPVLEPEVLPEPEPPVAQPEPESLPEQDTGLTPPPFLPDTSRDIDNDGLSFAEEILYHGNVSDPDTDKDGYLDGHEVENLYNPSGIAPEKIEDAGYARRFKNHESGYEILIPSAWTTSPLGEDSGIVSVQDKDGVALFEIAVMNNTAALPLRLWYESGEAGFAGSAPPSAWLSNRDGLEGLVAPDGSRAYFTNGSAIYSVGYAISARTESIERQYRVTFTLMLNSFTITE